MYKQALKYKAEDDWDNYYLYLIKSKNKKAKTELDSFNYISKIDFQKILPELEKIAIIDNNNKAQIAILIHYTNNDDKFFYYADKFYQVGLKKLFDNDISYSLGQYYQYEKKNIVKAIYYYEQCPEDDELYSDALNCLGLMYVKLMIKQTEKIEQFNMLSKAFEYFRKSIEKNNGQAMLNLATFLEKSGKLIIPNESKRQKIIKSLREKSFKDKTVIKHYLDLDKGTEKLKQDNKELKKLQKEIEELKTHIMAMPDGDLYFEAKKHYQDQLSTIKT